MFRLSQFLIVSFFIVTTGSMLGMEPSDKSEQESKKSKLHEVQDVPLRLFRTRKTCVATQSLSASELRLIWLHNRTVKQKMRPQELDKTQE